MFSFLSDFLQKKHIDCFAALPLEECRVVRPYLLEKAGIEDGSVILLAVPYYTPHCEDPRRNLSAYAIAKDYHLFFKGLFEEILPLLKARFPANRFAAFADHSPIDEVMAAAKAGLGVIGKNHLLITERYSSFVFLGEIVTDASLPSQIHEIRACMDCGACRSACPMTRKGCQCLSSVTQKKGELSPEEEDLLRNHPLVWGCDICQEVCPHTSAAKSFGTIYSPIPFFYEDILSHLTPVSLMALSDQAFSERAYAWRQRGTVERNLLLKQQKEK